MKVLLLVIPGGSLFECVCIDVEQVPQLIGLMEKCKKCMDAERATRKDPAKQWFHGSQQKPDKH